MDTFKTLIVPAALGLKAVAICDALGYPDKGCFTASFPHYLKFDGSDDFLATGLIDFSGTDKMTVFCGFEKLSDTTLAVVMESGSASGSVPGTIAIFAPIANTATNVAYRSGGSTPAAANPIKSNATSPFKCVLTGTSSISTPSAILRVNGIQEAVVTYNQGTGNYANEPLYIGRRGGTSLAFNGKLYSLVIRGAESDAAQITAGENYANSKTGAY